MRHSIAVVALFGALAFGCSSKGTYFGLPADGGGPFDFPGTDAAADEWGGSSSSGSTNGKQPPSGSCEGKRVFVTSTKYKGDLGGLTGADERCALAAEAEGLGGSFKAWLSSGSTNAIDRIEGEGPWCTLTKHALFNNRANLETSPRSTLITDERGVSMSYRGRAWTGPRSAGAHLHCDDWSVADYDVYAMVGRIGASDHDWSAIETARCSGAESLYCFEQ